MNTGFGRIIVGVALLAGCLACPLTGFGNERPRNPESVRETFNEISARLDVGGDLFVIVNTDGVIENLVRTGARLAEWMPPHVTHDPAASAGKVATLLKENGFYAVDGIGLSSAPREDGRYNLRLFVKRDVNAAALPLWRALIGAAPSPMTVLSYLPRDTVMVRSGTGDIRFLWRLIKTGIAAIGGPTAEAGFKAWMEMADGLIGTPLDALIASIAAEHLFAVCLSSEVTVTLPLHETTVAIPHPTLLLITAVRDDTLIRTVKETFARHLRIPLPETRLDDAVLYTLPLPMPAPIPVSITLATHGDYLLLGSTFDIVRDAVTAFRTGEGLTAHPEFQAAFPELAPNNGILYTSRRLGEVVADIQKATLRLVESDAAESWADHMGAWIDGRTAGSMALTIMNVQRGIRIGGTSSMSGRELAATLALAPASIAAGMTLPALIRSRSPMRPSEPEDARQICAHNLMMIDSAKEQWAVLHGKQDGDEPDESGVFEFVWGDDHPVCPSGGNYTLHPVGSPPDCSVHGRMDDR